MSDFGDFDVDDAFDTEPADPEQVARKIHLERARLELLRGRTLPRWEALDEDERAVALELVVIVLAWLRRQGAS